MQHQGSDLDVWNALQQGDPTAFARLYERYVRDLLRYGYRLQPNRQLVQDTVQDLFLHLWHIHAKLPSVESPRFYLYRSLRNRLINVAAAERLWLTPDGDLTETLFVTVNDAATDWINHEEQQQQYQRLHEALAKLPLKQQEAIQLRYHHNFSTEEVARLLNIEPQSARNILHRAIQQLRLLLPYAPLGAWLLGYIKKI